jgi:retinol dehydrogenase-12
VTGANTGVGKELAQILYSKHATVYVASRSQEKSLNAIKAIKEASPNSSGELAFLQLDLADLTTIKASAEKFLSKENKLHVLFNNAGVMCPPQGSKTPQGYELQLGTNNIGTFMFTKLLTPVLVATARAEPPSTVRIVWVASSATELGSPTPGGLVMDNLDYHNDKSPMFKYAISKVGNFFHATEYAKRYKNVGIVSISLNPGMLDSDLYRHQSTVFGFFLKKIVLHPPIFGAYTELFAGLSPEVTIERSGDWGEFCLSG